MALVSMIPSQGYAEERAAFWAAEAKFRAIALREILSALPAHVVEIRLVLNDTPRMTFARALDAAGNEIEIGEDLNDLVDSLAHDLQIYDWYEADNVLVREDDYPDNEFSWRLPEVDAEAEAGDDRG